MTKITESSIETFAIKLLERLGYEYIHAPDIAPDSERPERESFDQVLLTGRLEKEGCGNNIYKFSQDVVGLIQFCVYDQSEVSRSFRVVSYT